MSETPETDAAWAVESGNGLNEVKEISRKLERERDEAREKYDDLATEHMLAVNKICNERDEAQKELSSIHRWIDKNHADGFIDSLTYLQNLERVTDNWYDRIDAIETDARRFVSERDEAREQIKELIYISERAIALAEIDFENDKFGVVSELRGDLEKIKKSK
jgi:alkanesulfonate monooxygenase SsuD/methylene tetrahydromethanopterin reductase-like flavin-dependent oxidoreductase (luciferase family)